MRNGHPYNESNTKQAPTANASDGGNTKDVQSTSQLPSQKSAPNGDTYTVSNAELMEFYFDYLVH